MTPDIARANDTAPSAPELGALVQQTAAPDRPAATRGASAAAAPEMLDTYDRNAVLTAFVNQHDTLPTGSDVWSGNQTLCNAGDAPAQTRAGVLRRVNFFRAMAGVPSAVTLNAAYNAKAQQAALLMSANGKLSHAPASDWKCYNADGAQAAGSSDLALGASGPNTVDLYIQDYGSTNAPVGHRRWLLYPQTLQMGVGDMPAANGLRSANAIWVYDNMFGARPATRDGFVAWPPPGFVPYSIVYARWSLSLPNADFSQAVITMSNGAEQMVTRKEANAGGYGENTLVWVPDGLADNARWARPLTDTVYTVTVANVSVGGEKRTFSYNVTVFDPVFTGKAPTGIVLTSNMVEENKPAGTVIGAMSAVDPDAADGHTFKLINGAGGADNALFAIVGDTLVTSATFNYEEAGARTIRVQVTDHSGLSYVQIMTVDITNVNEAPALPRSEVVVKGDAYVYSIRAIDPEGDDSSVSVLSAPAWMSVKVDGTLITVSGSCSTDPGADNVVHLQLRDASGLTAEASLAFQAARTVILIPLIMR